MITYSEQMLRKTSWRRSGTSYRRRSPFSQGSLTLWFFNRPDGSLTIPPQKRSVEKLKRENDRWNVALKFPFVCPYCDELTPHAHTLESLMTLYPLTGNPAVPTA